MVLIVVNLSSHVSYREVTHNRSVTLVIDPCFDDLRIQIIKNHYDLLKRQVVLSNIYGDVAHRKAKRVGSSTAEAHTTIDSSTLVLSMF